MNTETETIPLNNVTREFVEGEGFWKSRALARAHQVDQLEQRIASLEVELDAARELLSSLDQNDTQTA